VLVVTPVLFFWIHERRLGLPAEAEVRRRAWPHARVFAAGLAAVSLAAGALAVWHVGGRRGADEGRPTGRIVQRLQADRMQIVLRSPTGTLRQGRNTFTMEFRAADGRLVDPGDVRASAGMTMPGMVMSGGLRVRPTAATGLYEVTGEFGMAGAWQMRVEWDGPAGQGSVAFEGAVQ
jgi:hypothetical protein